MILDSSAIIALLLREKGFEPILAKLASADHSGAGAPTLAETGIVMVSRVGSDGRQKLSAFIRETDLAVIPFGPDHWRTAVDAYQRYGKGRHAAGLNFGDCMTYATAKLSGQPLLCIGSEFGKTDLELA